MKLTNLNYDIKCDINGCKNMAKYAIKLNDNDESSTYICKDCLQELSKIVNQTIVPKGLENVIKKSMKKEVI